MSRIPLLTGLIVSTVFVPSAVHAQDAIAVVPASSDATSGVLAERAASAVRRALRAQGRLVLSPEEAAQRLRQRHSSEPTDVETGVYEELSTCANDLLVAVSAGRYESARETGLRCRELADSSLESLNRRTQAAREVLDTCLYVVRATIDSDSRQNPSAATLARARAETLRCRALVPDLPPNDRRHTQLIRDLLDEVDAELGDMDAALEVNSQQDGCRVYVNGRRLGSTPLRRTGLPPGSYRVQVECGDRPGRVHRVAMDDRSSTVTIDERFDSVVRTPLTESTLRLQYPSPSALGRHAFEDARTIREAIGAAEVWTVSPDGAGGYRVDRVDPAEGECEAVASALVAIEDGGGDLRFEAGPVVVDRLLEGQSVDLSTAREGDFTAYVSDECRAARTASAPTAPIDDSNSGDDAAPVAGWILGSAGLAAIATGWILWATTAADNDGLSLYPSAAWSNDERARWQDRWDSIRARETAGLIVTAAGALSLAIALPLFLPEEDDFPLWTLVPAAAGVGLAVLGAVYAALDGQCASEDPSLPDGFSPCTNTFVSGPLGGIALLSSIPLLEIPLVYLVRALVGPGADSTTLRIHPTQAGAAVALEGSW